MTKTHWPTLPPWEEICAEILPERESVSLSSPDDVPSDMEIPKELNDWDRRGRLIPWGSEMPELAIDEKGGGDTTDDKPLGLDGVVD
jgi:hypothetical protein